MRTPQCRTGLVTPVFSFLFFSFFFFCGAGLDFKVKVDYCHVPATTSCPRPTVSLKTIWHQQALIWCFHWKQRPTSPLYLQHTSRVIRVSPRHSTSTLKIQNGQSFWTSGSRLEELFRGAVFNWVPTPWEVSSSSFLKEFWNERFISKENVGHFFVRHTIQLSYFTHLLTRHDRKWAGIFKFSRVIPFCDFMLRKRKCKLRTKYLLENYNAVSSKLGLCVTHWLLTTERMWCQCKSAHSFKCIGSKRFTQPLFFCCSYSWRRVVICSDFDLKINNWVIKLHVIKSSVSSGLHSVLIIFSALDFRPEYHRSAVPVRRAAEHPVLWKWEAFLRHSRCGAAFRGKWSAVYFP